MKLWTPLLVALLPLLFAAQTSSAACRVQTLKQKNRCYTLETSELRCGRVRIGNIAKDKRRLSRPCKQHTLRRKIRILSRGRGWVSVEESLFRFTGGLRPYQRVTRRTWSTATGKVLSLRHFFPNRWKSLLRSGFEKFRKQQGHKMFQWVPNAYSYHSGLRGKPGRIVWQLPGAAVSVGSATAKVTLKLGVARGSSARLVTKAEYKALRKQLRKGKKPLIFPRKHTLQLQLPHFGQVALVPLTKGNHIQYNFVKKGRIVYRLASSACQQWSHYEMLAVALRDVDRDGSPDLVVMEKCITGMGAHGQIPFPAGQVFYLRGKRFVADGSHGVLSGRRFRTIGRVVRYARKVWNRLPRKHFIRAVTSREYRKLKRLASHKGQKIPRKHTFRVGFKSWGVGFFVPLLKTGRKGSKVHPFLLRKDGRYHNFTGFEGNQWWVEEIVAVATSDIDRDGFRDILMMADCMTGIGPHAARSFRVVSVYFQRRGSFVRNKKLDGMLSGARPKTLRKAIRTARKLYKVAR